MANTNSNTTATDLRSAISSALDTADKPDADEEVSGDATVELKEELKEDEKVDATGQEVSSSPYTDDLTENEIISARQLYKSLKNKDDRDTVIDFLATRSGYTKPGAIATNKDVKEAKATLTDELKTALGTEFDFLAPKLGPAIEKYLNSIKEENKTEIAARTQKLEERQEASELAKLEAEATVAEKNIAAMYFKDGKIPDNLSNMMVRLMDRLPPEPGQTTSSYIEEILKIAATKTNVPLIKVEKQRKIDANRNNIPNRLMTEKRPQEGAGEAKKMSLKDAVTAAVESANKA